MSGTTISIFLADPAATDRIGAVIAKMLRPGHILLLKGDLGAGKTALARAIIRTLANDPSLDVPSPSFSLVQPYSAGSQQVLHTDLYRLAGSQDIEELGILDDTDAIVLVEWPDRAPVLQDMANFIVSLDLPPEGEGRQMSLWSSNANDDLAARVRGAGFDL